MNAAASNLANAGSVTGSEGEAYRPMRPVFAEELDQKSNLSTVRVAGLYRSEAAPEKRYDPGNPMADKDGNVWESAVDESRELVDMMESARTYQNNVEVMQTAKSLIVDTLKLGR